MICTVEGCGELVRLTVERPEVEWTIHQDQIIKLNEISVRVKKGDTVTIPGQQQEVCADCGSEMEARWGYRMVS